MNALLEFKIILNDVAQNTHMPEKCYKKVLETLKNQIDNDKISKKKEKENNK